MPKRRFYDKRQLLNACNQIARETRMAERTTNTSMHIIIAYALYKSKGFGAKRISDVIASIDEYQNRFDDGEIDLKQMSDDLMNKYGAFTIEYNPYDDSCIKSKKNSFDYFIDSKEITLMNRINNFATKYLIFFYTTLAEKYGYREKRINDVHEEMMKHISLYEEDKTTVDAWRTELRDYVGIAFENPKDPNSYAAGSSLMGLKS